MLRARWEDNRRVRFKPTCISLTTFFIKSMENFPQIAGTVHRSLQTFMFLAGNHTMLAGRMILAGREFAANAVEFKARTPAPTKQTTRLGTPGTRLMMFCVILLSKTEPLRRTPFTLRKHWSVPFRGYIMTDLQLMQHRTLFSSVSAKSNGWR